MNLGDRVASSQPLLNLGIDLFIQINKLMARTCFSKILSYCGEGAPKLGRVTWGLLREYLFPYHSCPNKCRRGAQVQ